jgi:hypothetical protein
MSKENGAGELDMTKKIGLFMATIAIFAVGLIGFSACAGNAASVSVTPEFEDLDDPLPIEVTIDQVYQEYLADEAAANAKYAGKRLLFTNVEVEEINAHAVDPSAEVRNVYLVNSFVEFRPRYMIDVALVQVGFIVDIVGTPRGLFGIDQQYLVVDDASVFIIESDAGVVSDVPLY